MLCLQVKAALQPPTQGVVLQTYGAGNMPTRRKDIIKEIKQATDRGCLVVNCSQCIRGQVDANYATGKVKFNFTNSGKKIQRWFCSVHKSQCFVKKKLINK